MQLKEEKDLQAITELYTAAVCLFQKKEYKKANDAFRSIISSFKNSEYYTVQEIQTRSQTYVNMTESLLYPSAIELKNPEDYLWEGVYQLNSGRLDQAAAHFEKAEKEKENDPFLLYLIAITNFRLNEEEKAYDYLKRCITIDSHYKITAYNEPDFEPWRTNSQFLSLVG